jgi:uncharacterized membrane protein
VAYSERLVRPKLSAPALGGIGFAVAIFIVIAANWDVRKGENGGVGPAIGTSIICLVLAGFLFGFVVPRAKNLDRTALILGSLAIVSVLVFWSGITPVLATAALAVAGRDETPPSRAVVIVSSLGILAALVAVIITAAQSHLF